MNKIKLKLNDKNINIVDVIDDIIKKFDVEIIDYDNYKIILKYDEFDDEIIKFIENKYDVECYYKYKNSSLISINDNIKIVEINIVDPIYIPFLYNENVLIEIFDENINNIDNLFECNIKEIKLLCYDEIYKLFDKYNNLSSYDILLLFENIIEIVNELNIENKNEYNNEFIECYELNELFKYVIDDLYKKFDRFDIYKSFKLSLINTYEFINILINNHYYINDDTLYNNVDECIIIDDLNNNIDDELIELLDICYDNNINSYIFYEYNLINSLNNDLSTNINYYVEFDDDENIIENSIELCIDDLLILNNQISNNTNNINRLVYDPIKYLNELFENVNNSYDYDEFIYNLFENEYEILNDELFYDKYYYTISNNYKFKYNIYDLKKYVLNYLSNLNLNNSFKFDDELYYLY